LIKYFLITENEDSPSPQTPEKQSASLPSPESEIKEPGVSDSEEDQHLVVPALQDTPEEIAQQQPRKSKIPPL
jgi:hypothetical protein